jgi:hypothetical protein
VQLGSVVAASIAYSNNLDKVETIRPTAKSKTPTPAWSMGSGNITVRFKDTRC